MPLCIVVIGNDATLGIDLIGQLIVIVIHCVRYAILRARQRLNGGEQESLPLHVLQMNPLLILTR